MNYKLIITNQTIYKEIELSETLQKITIGTTKMCEVRLQREDFFEDFSITLLKINGYWTWNSSDNIYISADSIRKLQSKDLNNGDDLKVYYMDTEAVLFEVYFYNNFQLETQKYNRKIHLDNLPVVKIGTDIGSDIIIHSQFAKGEIMQMTLGES